MHINGPRCIEIGEILLDATKKARSDMSEQIGDVARITLRDNELINLSMVKGKFTGKRLFDRQILPDENWSLDIVHKMKPDTDILHMSLKQGGEEVIKGAYSKSNKNGKAYSKFHFTEGEIYLTTGETTKFGTLAKQRRQFVLPMKYYGYLWWLKERNLQIISDLFGLCGKMKTADELAKIWGVQSNRIKKIRENSLLLTRELIKHNWKKPIELTKGKLYSIFDYIRALKYIKEYGDNSAHSEKANSVIYEWRMAKSKMS